jgi:hypothetical protein
MLEALFSSAPEQPSTEELLSSAPRFEPPPELRLDVLAEDVRETLRSAEELGQLEETARLLEEYLAFLRHRLEE